LKQVAYILDYSTPSGTVKLDKYDIPLPVKPPVEAMVNYGLPIAEQKFKRTIVPRSLLRKKNNLTFEEEAFIQQEYHKRKNGVWMLIKGEPVYLTGPYYAFLNYWWTKNGTQPDFRYTQSLIFLFWDMVVRDTNCLRNEVGQTEAYRGYRNDLVYPMGVCYPCTERGMWYAV
jgi:hypothetical protein